MEQISFESELSNTLEFLRRGEMVLFPTDTGWVIGIDATIDRQVKLLKSCARKQNETLLTILLADEKDLLKYVSSLDLEIFNFLDQQKTPVAILCDGLVGISDEVLDKDHKVPVRIAREDFSRHLLKRFRKPLAVFTAGPQCLGEAAYSVSDSVINHIFEPQRIVMWSPKEVVILQP